MDLIFSIVLIIRINTVDNIDIDLSIDNQNAKFGADAAWNQHGVNALIK